MPAATAAVDVKVHGFRQARRLWPGTWRLRDEAEASLSCLQGSSLACREEQPCTNALHISSGLNAQKAFGPPQGAEAASEDACLQGSSLACREEQSCTNKLHISSGLNAPKAFGPPQGAEATSEDATQTRLARASASRPSLRSDDHAACRGCCGVPQASGMPKAADSAGAGAAQNRLARASASRPSLLCDGPAACRGCGGVRRHLACRRLRIRQAQERAEPPGTGFCKPSIPAMRRPCALPKMLLRPAGIWLTEGTEATQKRLAQASGSRRFVFAEGRYGQAFFVKARLRRGYATPASHCNVGVLKIRNLSRLSGLIMQRTTSTLFLTRRFFKKKNSQDLPNGFCSGAMLSGFLPAGNSWPGTASGQARRQGLSNGAGCRAQPQLVAGTASSALRATCQAKRRPELERAV